MHEESLVRALLRQSAGIAAAHTGSRIDLIEVEIGPLSGVEDLLLQSAFERLTSRTEFALTRLQVRHVPLVLLCEPCGHETRTDELNFHCESCQSPRVRIVRGDEFRLMSLELDVPADANTVQQTNQPVGDVAANIAANS